MAAIGVALSGGGHRATAWSLGTLLYLVDSGQNRDVVSIASVSGGSITNGVIAHEVNFKTVDGEGFRAAMRPLLRLVARDGLFAWGRATNVYLLSVLVSALAFVGTLVAVGATLVRALRGNPSVRGTLVWLAAAGVMSIVTVLLFSRRSKVVDGALQRTLYSRDGKGTALAALHSPDRPVGHVFCATELQAADHFYFAPQFVATHRLGAGIPADLALSTAVQCSACLPGAFRARKLNARKYEMKPFPNVDPQPVSDRFLLYDGGVYSNMADEWHQSFTRNVEAWPELKNWQQAPEVLIVANASGDWTWKPLTLRALLLGELDALMRAKSILYDGTTSTRRKSLTERFDQAMRTGVGLQGSIVHIPQSPWWVANRLAKKPVEKELDAKRPERAERVLELLRQGPLSEREWTALAERNAKVRTTLGKLGEEQTVDLLYHAYVLAMGNLHIILDFPLLELPDREKLRALLR